MALSALCRSCCGRDDGTAEMLHELAHMDERTLEVLRRMSQYHHGRFFEQVRAGAERRIQTSRGTFEDNRQKLTDFKESFSNRLLEEIMGGGDAEACSSDRYLTDMERVALEEEVAAGTANHSSVEERDLKEVIERYCDMGLLDEAGGRLRITPRGSRKLARHILKEVLETVDIPVSGTNPRHTGGVWCNGGLRHQEV